MDRKLDTKIFKNNDNRCNGYHDCSCMKRLMTALSYHSKISSQQPQAFIDFCDKYYSNQYLEDYIHCICMHENDINKDDMENTKCTMVSECKSTNRHYMDRSVKDDNNNVATSHRYFDTFDTLHFYVYHMVECGFRISINEDVFKDIEEENENEYINCADKLVAAIRKEIEKKKEKCGLFTRLDDAKNSKFNVMPVHYDDVDNDAKENETDGKTEMKTQNINKKQKKSVWGKMQTAMTKHFSKKDTKTKIVSKENSDQYDVETDKTDEKTEANESSKEEMTFTDDILNNVRSFGVAENVVSALKQYLTDEEYDTDGLQNDIDIYKQQGKSNLLEATGYNLKCMEEIAKQIKMTTIASAALSTGFVFWYWPFYKNIHEIEDLFMIQKFSSLKAEVLNSKLISIEQFKEKVIRKGNAYFQTEKCKNIKCIERHDGLHFGIKEGAALKRDHLYSLILYCDFITFSNYFSSTFQRAKWNEPVSSVRQRNRKYFHISKHLREVVEYYGIDNDYDNKNGRESGPFFASSSIVLNVSEFCIGLNGPTSTTVYKEIGIRSAGNNGMLIELNNRYYPGTQVRFFDVSWLSGFAEEEERIFIGGRFKMALQTVIIMETTNNYKRIFAAFYKLDMILSGSYDIGHLDILMKDIYIVKWFITYMFGGAENENKFDSFLKNTFYFFSQRKTQIALNLVELSNVKNRDFVELVMNKIEKTGEMDMDRSGGVNNKIPSTRTNLFRGCLLTLFENVEEIVLYSTGYNGIYSFNILKLLSLLEERELSKSFKRIIIKDQFGTGWLKSALSEEVKKTFALKNLKINLKSETGGYGGEKEEIVINV